MSSPATPVARSITALSAGEILARIAAFGATTLLARRLGPEGFGILGFAAALSGYLSVAITNGIQEIGVREVARAPHRARELYASVTLVQLLTAACAFTALAAVAMMLPHAPPAPLVVLLSGLSFFSLALDPSWALKGLERPVTAVAVVVVAQMLYAVAVVGLVGGRAQLAAVPVLQFAAEAIAALIFGAVLLGPKLPKLHLSDGWHVLRSTGYLGAAKVLRTVVITSDVVLLGFMTTEHDVGLYTAAYRVTFLLMSISTAVSTAYLPSYARLAGGIPADMKDMMTSSLRTTSIVAAPLVAGVVVTARPLLTLLFGAPYGAAADALRLLALSIGLVFLYSPASNVLMATGRTGLIAGMRAAAAVLNIVLNVVLIPRYGIFGAAISTCVAEAAVLILSIAVVHRDRLLPPARTLLPSAIAAGLMSVILLFAGGSWPVPLQIAVGGAVYVAALWMLGALPMDLLGRTVSRNPVQWS
jgi:O-antigen/teichoic acid export membrane protein